MHNQRISLDEQEAEIKEKDMKISNLGSEVAQAESCVEQVDLPHSFPLIASSKERWKKFFRRKKKRHLERSLR